MGWWPGSREPSREDLIEERYRLRRLVLDLVPPGYKDVLTSFYRCETPEEAALWLFKSIKDVLELSRPDSLDIRWIDQPRVYCPLCGSGTTALYEEGYAYPEGLERHLEGRSNVHACPVVEVAHSAARDFWESRFADEVEAQRREEQVRLLTRRRDEVSYIVSLAGVPLLSDEYVDGDGRDAEGLTWAGERLKVLGFNLIEEDRTKQFVWEDDSVWAIADPRRSGSITILIYKKPLPKRPRSVRPGRHTPVRFELPDRWKNNLPTKFKQAIDLATTRGRKRTDTP